LREIAIHFIVARSSLRTILGAYLKKESPELSFSYSNYGKPSLFGEPPAERSQFQSVTRERAALIAVTRNRDDWRRYRIHSADFASEEIAERFFSRPEGQRVAGAAATCRAKRSSIAGRARRLISKRAVKVCHCR